MAEGDRSPIDAGTLVAGKYRVGEVIARGGMGAVLAARHEGLDQRVAIKVLLPDSTAHPELVQRFLREARAAVRIESDHVVRVFDVGTHEGAPYMAMEYLEGSDLAAVVSARGPLPIGEAVDYVLEALEAIAEAHTLGIVHRDLKPANLFLASRPDGSRRIKVLDFGISKVGPGESPGDPALTSTRSMLGSPGYMSPEQVRSTKGVDARTDVWSVGVILYELLTGEPAFTGETLGDIFAKIREEPLPPLRAVRADAPEELEAVVMRCLERDRAKRYADGVALREALGPYATTPRRMTRETSGAVAPRRAVAHAEAETIAAVGLDPGANAADARSAAGARGQTQSTWSGSGPAPRVTTRAAIAAAIVLGAGAVAAFVVTRGHDEAPSLAEAPSTDGRAPVAPGTDTAPQATGAPPSPEVTVSVAGPVPSAEPSAAPSATAAKAAASRARAPVSKPAAPPPNATSAAAPPQTTSNPARKRDDLGI